MIDTDKYEGHTPAPWDSLVCSTTGKKWVIDGTEDSAWKSIALIDGVGENDVGWKNMALIADAPLLLKEVKRLRRAFRIATAHIGFGNHLGHAELRRALNSVGIDYNSLPWADEEWEEPLPTFGGVAHYD